MIITTTFTESVVEWAALARLEGLGWRVAHSPDQMDDTAGAGRVMYYGVLRS